MRNLLSFKLLFPLQVMYHFSCCFQDFSLSSVLRSLFVMCLAVDFFGFSLLRFTQLLEYVIMPSDKFEKL